MKLCMFRPLDTDMERGWVGRVDGHEVVHLAAQTLQHLFTGGGSARDHARYALGDVVLLNPLPWPPSVRAFDEQGSFEFANPAAVAGPAASIAHPAPSPIVVDAGLAGLVGLDAVVAVSPVARLRATALAPPKDRDFGIVLGPWFTTIDEAPVAPTVSVVSDGVAVERTGGCFDWEAARRRAAEHTRLRVGDLLLAPATTVAGVPPGAAASVSAEGLGTLSFSLEAA